MVTPSSNPLELLFTTLDFKMVAAVENYTEPTALVCMSPEDILGDLEEEYNCPLIYLTLR